MPNWVRGFGPIARAGRTRVLLGLEALAVGVLLVPVQDATHEGGDEGDAGLRAGHRLGEGEQQGHVAVDPMLLLQLPEGRDGGVRSEARHRAGCFALGCFALGWR